MKKYLNMFDKKYSYTPCDPFCLIKISEKEKNFWKDKIGSLIFSPLLFMPEIKFECVYRFQILNILGFLLVSKDLTEIRLLKFKNEKELNRLLNNIKYFFS